MRPLGRDNVELNPVNNEGLAPLAGTAQYGYVETMKPLLGCQGVDLSLGDRDGHSILSLAAKATVLQHEYSSCPSPRKSPWLSNQPPLLFTPS